MAPESPRFVRYVHDELAQEWAKCVDAKVEQSAVRLEAAAMDWNVHEQLIYLYNEIL